MRLSKTLVMLVLCLGPAPSLANAQSQQTPPSVMSSTPAMTQAEGTTTKITNARVVQMTKMGLHDDVIVARIKHGVCDFQPTDNDLVELKEDGVSSKVVAAMMDTAPTVAAPLEPSDGKVRVFVTDGESWETRGSSAAGGNSNGWAASSSFSGGARPQTAEIVKTLNQRCPELTVTNILGKANFVIVMDHEAGRDCSGTETK